MNDNLPSQHRAQRVHREYTLMPGHYWRCYSSLESGNKNHRVDLGTLLMIQEVKSIEGIAHTVILRHHPTEPKYLTRELLIEDFLDHFEPISTERAQALRNQEMADIQSRIESKQAHIQALSSSPDTVIKEIEALRKSNPDDEAVQGFSPAVGLPAPGRNHSELGPITSEELAHWQAQTGNHVALVTARAALIERETRELSDLVKFLSPFHLEQADAALAQARALQKDVNEIHKALHTLELYTGENVKVEALVDGRRSVSGGPYAIRQRCLFMDEESLINAEFGGADFRDLPAFAELLETDTQLRDRLLPETRCIAAMRYRRYSRDYGDLANDIAMNLANAKVFLLVRDGERIDVVFSPLDYLPRLFPATDDMNRPFRGMDGTQITVDDVRYVDSRQAQDDIALMYRRLLIMLWGLYDRNALFGRFDAEASAGHLNLLDPTVQASIFDFVADDDDSRLLGPDRPRLRDWFISACEGMAEGSMVVGHWSRINDEMTMPHCFSSPVFRDPEKIRAPIEPVSIEQVKGLGEDATTRVRVAKCTSQPLTGKTTQATVDLSDARSLAGRYLILVLDGLSSVDVRPWLNSTEAKQNYEAAMPVIIAAYRHLRAREADRVPFYRTVADVAGNPAETDRDLCTDPLVIQGADLALHRRRVQPSLLGNNHEVTVCAAKIVTVLRACLSEDENSRHHPTSSDEIPAAIAGWLRGAGEDMSDVICVDIDARGRLVVSRRPSKARMESVDWPICTIDEHWLALCDRQVESQPHGAISQAVMSGPGPSRIRLWERRAELSSETCPRQAPTIKDDRTIEFWRQRAEIAPRLSDRDISSRQTSARQGCDSLMSLVTRDASADAYKIWTTRALEQFDRELGSRDRMVHHPLLILPVAIVPLERPYERRPARPGWMCLRVDALAFLHTFDPSPNRDAIRERVYQVYANGDAGIRRIAQDPIKADFIYRKLDDVPGDLTVQPSSYGDSNSCDLEPAKADEQPSTVLWTGLSAEDIDQLSSFVPRIAQDQRIIQSLMNR